MIYTVFWGFYAACNVPVISPEVIGGQITGEAWTATNIYLAPTSLSAITFNFLMSLLGGLMAAYIISKGNPFWTFSGGLAGSSAAAGADAIAQPSDLVELLVSLRSRVVISSTFGNLL